MINLSDTLGAASIDSSRRNLARRFRAGGIETPELDAQLLVGAALGLDLTAMVARGEQRLTAAETARLTAMAERRLGGVPIARILGRKEFWGLCFDLSADTLVPRPDTETVVEAALAFLRGAFPKDNALRIADVGTGSGAILLALLSELPNAHGVGTDIAPGALTMALANAERLGLSDRATFVASDYLATVEGTFGLIVSNPPYVRSADIASLAREVRDHEPRRALDGGADGLAAYRSLCGDSPARLRAGGALIVEVGYGQADDVARLMEAAGLMIDRPYRRDLAGIQRVVVGQARTR